MPHYLWKGPGNIEETELARARPVRVDHPIKPELEGPAASEEGTRLFECTVEGCGKKFKKAMLVARHFNGSHDELREDKDSWREFSEEVWE